MILCIARNFWNCVIPLYFIIFNAEYAIGMEQLSQVLLQLLQLQIFVVYYITTRVNSYNKYFLWNIFVLFHGFSFFQSVNLLQSNISL